MLFCEVEILKKHVKWRILKKKAQSNEYTLTQRVVSSWWQRIKTKAFQETDSYYTIQWINHVSLDVCDFLNLNNKSRID